MILVGSRYFFGELNGFRPKDSDYVLLTDDPKGFEYVRQTTTSYCLFEWKKMHPQEYIDYALSKGPAMQLGKFLVPEFCEEIGFTLEHLKQLEPLAEKLDDKHKYEKVIYGSYMENGSMTLTDEQLEKAYSVYKEHRANESSAKHGGE